MLGKVTELPRRTEGMAYVKPKVGYWRRAFNAITAAQSLIFCIACVLVCVFVTSCSGVCWPCIGAE